MTARSRDCSRPASPPQAESADRRFTYRLELPEDRVRLIVPGGARAVVADLSASGSGLIVAPDDLLGVTAEPAIFELESGRSFRVRLDPVRVSPAAGQLRVGARFQDLPVAGMRVLSEFLIREFLEGKRSLDRLLEDPRTLTSTNSKFIRRHLRRCLLIEQRPLRVYDHARVLPGAVVVTRFVEQGGRHLLAGCVPQASLFEGAHYTFVVALSGSVMHFTARVAHRSGDTVLIELPEQLHHAGFRNSIRTRVAAQSRATVRCTHPRLPEEITNRAVLDLSARGFSFESDAETDLLFPGDRLGFVEVSFADEAYQVRGVIRGIAPHAATGLYSCGVEIMEFAHPAQERRWRDRAFRHAHPRALIAEPAAAAELAWRVLDSSGYVRLWAPRDNIERVRTAYAESWGDPQREMGRLVLVENKGSAVGTLAGSLLYPKAWLVHQLGVDERERGGIGNFLSLAYELYSGLLNLFQSQEQAEYFVIFAERDRRWSEVLYGDFVARYPESASLAYQENRVFRRDVQAPVSRKITRSKSVELGPADPADISALSERLRSTSSRVEFDALAFSDDELELQTFERTCESFGCERRRRVCVARENGVALAAVLLESGSEGINIFGLMNRCSIVSLASSPVSPTVKALLLDHASEYFRALGKQVFLFFDAPDADIAAVALLGFEFVSDGVRFIGSKRVVPAWLSYLRNILTLREASGDSCA